MSINTDKLDLEAEEAAINAELAGTSEQDLESASTEEAEADATSTTSQEEETSNTQTEENNWVVPGRFRTTEDVLQSYRNLESAYGQSQSELHKVRRQADSTRQSNPDDELKQFANEVKENPIKAIRRVARTEFEKELEEVKYDKFVSAYQSAVQNPEFARLEPIMTQVVESHRDIISKAGLDNDPRLFEILYSIARGVDSQQQSIKAMEAGKIKGAKETLKKQKIQVEGASSSKGRSVKKFEDLSLEEMEKEIASGNV